MDTGGWMWASDVARLCEFTWEEFMWAISQEGKDRFEVAVAFPPDDIVCCNRREAWMLEHYPENLARPSRAFWATQNMVLGEG